MDFLRKLCRICRCHENLCDLSSQANEEALKKLIAVTTIRIQANDSLPRCICHRCIDTLNVVYDFLRRCEAAEKRLQEVLRQEAVGHHGGKEDVTTPFVKEEPVDTMEDGQLPCVAIPANYTTEGEEDRKDIILEEAKIAEPVQMAVDGENKLICENCGSTFEKATDLRQHMKSHVRTRRSPNSEGQNYRCKGCSNSYKTGRSLKRHVQSVHLGQKPFACNLCEKAFSQKAGLDAHQSMHVQERNFSCDLCLGRFKTRKHLKQHMIHHLKITEPKQETEPVECDICHKFYANKPSLRKHKVIHSDSSDSNLMCTFCEKTFKIKGQLKVHLRTHTKEQPYECNVCPKKFSHSTSLKTHLMMHSDERPYKCDLCEMTFRQINHLKSHKLTHSGKKAFECTVCKKAFAFQKHLTVHERIHESPTASPFQCGICVGKKLNDSSALKRHLKAHPKAKVVKTETLMIIVEEDMSEEQEPSEVMGHIKEEPSDVDSCLEDVAD